jgi:hypothetical protein
MPDYSYWVTEAYIKDFNISKEKNSTRIPQGTDASIVFALLF